MSDIEKDLAEKLAELPTELQDRFLAMAQGAAMALESREKEPPKEKNPEDAV